MFVEELPETVGDTRFLRDTGQADHPVFQLRSPTAFFHSELAEQKESFAWRGGDPVRITPSSVQHDMGTFAGTLVGQFNQDVLQFERTDLRHFLFVFTGDYDFLVFFHIIYNV